MHIIIFSCGLIIGMMVRDIKTNTIESIEKHVSYGASGGSAQFFESVSDREKFKSANSIDDLIT